MYLFYMLFMIVNVVVCSEFPLVPPATPPQDIKGRHFRKVSVTSIKIEELVQKKNNNNDDYKNFWGPDTNDSDIHDDDMIFVMDE